MRGTAWPAGALAASRGTHSTSAYVMPEESGFASARWTAAGSKTTSNLAYTRMLSTPEDPLGTRSTRNGSLRRRTLPALLAVVISVIGGCAALSPPSPATVASKDASKEESPYLLLRLGERRLYLKGDHVEQDPEGYLVAIGRPKYPTPTGHFTVRELVRDPDFMVFDFEHLSRPNRGRIPPGPNNPLGLRWIGFAEAHGWVVGFHGTSKTSVLGQAVSHGCVRMRNEDIVKVFDRIKVGTPVIVEP
jgi:hypothetical protein